MVDRPDRTAASRQGCPDPLTTRAVASVVIPAHDESAGLEGTLSALMGGLVEGTLRVAVVCNGCTDDTAAIARRFADTHPEVEVHEIDVASKIAALRDGDRLLEGMFPRIYLDGDVRLEASTAIALANALCEPRALVAGVRAQLDLRGVSRPARLFHRFAYRLPVFEEGIIGAGVYALNAEGRARFGSWPEILGDDQFVYRLFGDDERVVLDGHASVVRPTPTLRGVVTRGVRIRRGNAELSAGAGGLELPRPRAGFRRALVDALRTPVGWIEAVTFLATSVAIRLLFRLTKGRGDWQGTR
jgi:hypothetical protein